MLKRLALIVLACAMCVCCLAGCSSGGDANSKGRTDTIRMGTMPNEHLLPAWVAEKEGFFADAGIDVEIISFDSAQALSAAIAAGEIDMAMVDIPRAVKLTESGTPVVIEWVTLGTEDGQGHFGVAAPTDANYSSLKELAEKAGSGEIESGVGVAANTVPEYVFDMLCLQEGIDPAAIPTVEVASLPERYSLMASGKIAAAALPGSMMEFAKANGMKILADESDGEGFSQSIMIATAKFASSNEEDIMKAAKAWDKGVEAIGSDPESYKPLLLEKANLNSSIIDSYKISSYPLAISNGKLAHPAADIVDTQIEWMSKKGYSAKSVRYDQSTGELTS